MIIYQGAAGYSPAKRPYQDLTSETVGELEAFPRSISVLELGGNAEEDTDAKSASPRRPQPREARSRRGRRSQATVLVVDDEVSVRETIVELLSLYGYRVIPAASAQEAEEVIQRLSVTGIHLLIVDVHLTPQPQARAGYVLAQRWRATYSGLPIILISGDPSNQALPDVRSGAMSFLHKPFRMEVLLETVREALRR
jgi:CheY-like chemotaxis protein